MKQRELFRAIRSICPTPARLKRMLAERDGGTPQCAWCSCELTLDPADRSRPYATVDHILPSSQGGSRHPNNLVLACEACNRRRADTPAEEFLEQLLRKGVSVREEVVRAAIRRLHSQPYVTKDSYRRYLYRTARVKLKRHQRNPTPGIRWGRTQPRSGARYSAGLGFLTSTSQHAQGPGTPEEGAGWSRDRRQGGVSGCAQPLGC